MNEQKPSIGRIVIYNGPEGGEVPAIIQRVSSDGTVWLSVFLSNGPAVKGGVKQGYGPNQWNWPPRT